MTLTLRRVAALALCAFAAAAPCGAQALSSRAPPQQASAPAASRDPAAQADALLAGFTADKPGLSVLVARGGRVLYARERGAADLEHGAPVTPRSQFLIGSVTKQFTAFAVTQLAFAGKLDLDADVRAYIPELPDYGVKITVSDLIHHTSGLRDQVELMALSGTPVDGWVRQKAALAMIFRQKGLNFAPGADFRYSNTNYTLLAEIVERRSGQSFRRYVADHILAPLGMTDSFIADDAHEILPGRVSSYETRPGGKLRAGLLNYDIYGSTGLRTTSRDLLKWSRELMHPSVFDPRLVRAVETPGRLRDGRTMTYASGMIAGPFAGRRALQHAGADSGYRAILVSFPDEDATVVVLSNGEADIAGLAAGLADAFLPASPAPHPPPTVVAADSRRVAALAGRYSDAWGPGLDFAARDGGLSLEIQGMHIPVTFLAGGDFYVASPQSRFSVDAAGDLVGASSLSGTPIVYRRAVRAKPSAEELAALAGDYRSDEIDTTFTLRAGEGHMRLLSLRDDPVDLWPAEADAFETTDLRYPAIRMRVLRDGRRVAGFALDTGRMRDLRFTPVQPSRP